MSGKTPAADPKDIPNPPIGLAPYSSLWSVKYCTYLLYSIDEALAKLLEDDTDPNEVITIRLKRIISLRSTK